ncbi:hypothetical protein [Streptomyces sp. NPDC059262]|uniref:hypothetical protein n=1 Tax=Streptomyces sp. NPDC059262 TaxID=3346797 RepID=UPI00369DF289
MSETPEEQRQERRVLREKSARQRRRLAARLTGWAVLLVALAVVAWASVHS